MPMVINGETLTDSQVEYYRRVLRNDCIKFAGEFHGMNRSRKFRANWPNEYEFAEANWKNFVSSVRQLYAEQLRSPHLDPEKQETIFRALIVDSNTNIAAELSGIEGNTSLQLAPNTQQFVGDRKENTGISDKFGDQPHTLRKALLSTGTRFH